MKGWVRKVLLALHNLEHRDRWSISKGPAPPVGGWWWVLRKRVGSDQFFGNCRVGKLSVIVVLYRKGNPNPHPILFI